MKKFLTLLLVAAVTTLAGCGQSGALYLPEPAQESPKTAQ